MVYKINDSYSREAYCPLHVLYEKTDEYKLIIVPNDKVVAYTGIT